MKKDTLLAKAKRVNFMGMSVRIFIYRVSRQNPNTFAKGLGDTAAIGA
jgi:hypothetical protein